jgi:C1A family cysteine protease
MILLVHVVETYRIKGMGYIPDPYSFRDYDSTHEQVSPILKKTGLKGPLSKAHSMHTIKPRVDLRDYCSPIENQGELGSCCAHAAVGAVEFCEKRSYGTYRDASRLFLYKVARKLAGVDGDVGAFPRTTMAALTLFGVPPEDYWEYNIDRFDDEPTAFCYAFAESYKPIKYIRLDQPDVGHGDLLKSIKLCLSIGFPLTFGFPLFISKLQAEYDNKRHRGKLPYPCARENIIGLHSVLAVGYDDDMKIENAICNKETKGAFLIQNSWGIEWGEYGYGWLPYDYVKNGMALDWWTITKQEWVDTGKFNI